MASADCRAPAFLALLLVLAAQATACPQRDRAGNCVTSIPLEDEEASPGHALFQSGPSAIGAATTVLEDPFDALVDEFADGAGFPRAHEAPSSVFERFVTATMAFFTSDVFKHMDDDFDNDLSERRSRLAKMPPEIPLAELEPEGHASPVEDPDTTEVLKTERSGCCSFFRDMFVGALGAYCFFLLRQAQLQWGAPDLSADEQQEDVWGCSRLHTAAAEGDAGLVEGILQHSQDHVDAREAWGETPLHMAARQGSIEVCSVLLANGADVNAVNDSDETPLLVAAKAGNQAASVYLLDCGAGVGGASPDALPSFLNILLMGRMMQGLVQPSTSEDPRLTSA